MTVTSTAVRSEAYAGDGVTTAFPVPFQFQDSGDVRVIQRHVVTGAETTVTSGYTVTGGGGGTGTVTALVPPPAGVLWVIVRQTPQTQPTDWQDGDRFPAALVEGGLDRLTMALQEASDRASRSLRLPDSDPSANTTLPVREARARKALVFDAQGNVTHSIDDYNDQAARAFASAEEARRWSDDARAWAIQTGTPVSDGQHSAKHHAGQAAESADSARFSAAGAAESARAAAASAAGVKLPPVTAADAGKVLTATSAGALTLQAPGVAVQVNSGPGSAARPAINLIAGAGVEFVMTDNPSANRVDVTIVAARPVTLDPANRGADVRLSPDWLTATPVQHTARGGCRATAGRAYGKWYFECEGGFREETGVGFVTSTVDVSAVDVSAVAGACLLIGYPNGDKIVRAGGVTYPLSGENPYGDKRTGIACDIDARKWWRRVNGVWQDGGNPLTGANSLPGFPSGVVYPLVRIRNFPGETVTMRFHPQTWQDPAPAGFNPL